MTLKVVPAGDERCDIHNGRQPATYVCKSCAEELGMRPGPVLPVGGHQVRRIRRLFRRGPFRRVRRAFRRSRLRRHPRLLAAIGIGIAVAAIAAVVVLTTGGGGATNDGTPTEAEVVEALDLSPDPSGTGWITLDGACSVLSIRVGSAAESQPLNSETVATNETGTVRAVVVESFSQGQAACVDRISAALRANF